MLRSFLVWSVVLTLAGCSLTVSLDGLTEAKGGSGLGGIPGSQTSGGSAGASLAGKGGGAGVAGAGGPGGSGTAGGSAGTSGSAGAGGTSGLQVDETCPLSTPDTMDTFGGDLAVRSMGVSKSGRIAVGGLVPEDGFGLRNTLRAWDAFGDTQITTGYPAPQGDQSSNLIVFGTQVYGVINSTGSQAFLFTFKALGGLPCDPEFTGEIQPMSSFKSCTTDQPFPLAVGASYAVVGTRCGVQHITPLDACPKDPGKITVSDPAVIGYADATYALALSDAGVVYSLERTAKNTELLHLQKKLFNNAKTNAEYESSTEIDGFAKGEAGAELVLLDARLYTILVRDSGSTILYYDIFSEKPSRHVVAERPTKATQLSALPQAIYWAESRGAQTVIWEQTSTRRRPIACPDGDITGLTVNPTGAYWRAASGKQAIYRQPLPKD